MVRMHRLSSDWRKAPLLCFLSQLLVTLPVVNGQSADVVPASRNTTETARGDYTNPRTGTSFQHRSTPGLPSSEQTETDTEESDSADAGLDLDDLLDSDLDTLRNTRVATPDLNAEVTSVARTEVAIGKTPAAIFVITEEMIRRSTAPTLPDVLRMVPGLNVAKSSNGRWSIGARGTGAIFADSLQVQIDGRSIYTPVFGGVVWQVRDMPLSDIERIEIIRGPGASVWGANAVSGVYQHCDETQ